MRVLMLCGSLRRGSTNAAALATAAAGAPDGVEVVGYDGLAALPPFNPDVDVSGVPEEVAGLRAAIGSADALLICAPEYAGTLPGAFKNLLDWTVGGGEMDGRPVAWINAASLPGRGTGAIDTLRTVLGWVGARVVDAACVTAPMAHGATGPDGLAADPEVAAVLHGVIPALVAAITAPASA